MLVQLILAIVAFVATSRDGALEQPSLLMLLGMAFDVPETAEVLVATRAIEAGTRSLFGLGSMEERAAG